MKKNIITPVFYTQLPNGRMKIINGMAFIEVAIKATKNKRPLIKHHKTSNQLN